MNTVIQNILVFSALVIALSIIIKTYFWSPKKKKAKSSCGNDNGCGCH